MTQSENSYQQDVFLEDLRYLENRHKQRIWAEHQEMQLSFLKSHGLNSSSIVLDLGCGPMRLGSVLIPMLIEGWYFGQDINPNTLPLARRFCARVVYLVNHVTLFFLLIILTFEGLIDQFKLLFLILYLVTLLLILFLRLCCNSRQY